jgi:hypothetical protein
MLLAARAFSSLRTAVICGVCAGALAAGSSAAYAQDFDDPVLDALFAQTVAQPLNYDLAFQFVKVATERGDYEAAIGVLERLLNYNPRLTRVKYELGALYFRLGSYEMARRYFRDALRSPDVDHVTRARIETYLPDAEKQSESSRWAGFLAAGLRYQTNPGFAPNTGTIMLGGQEFALLPTVQRQPDWNWYGVVGVSHEFDLNNQRGDVFETRFVGYGTQQFRFDELNVGLFDLNMGPRFALSSEYLAATIRPYAVVGKTWVGGDPYLSTAGAGIEAKIPIGDWFALGPAFEWRRASVDPLVFLPVSGFATGDWYTVALAWMAKLSQTTRVESRFLYRRGTAEFAWQNYHQWVGEAALVMEFAPPHAIMSRNWSIAPYVRIIQTQWDAANPFIDPVVVRDDIEWIVGAMFNAPIAHGIGVSAVVQYAKTDSSLVNYRTDNFSVMVGPTARF